MPYVGKKPADIIATAVDTTTGTFSGDLTVDTSTLYVDSANNRVGVGTASPQRDLVVNSGSSSGYIQLVNTASGTTSSNGLEIKLDSGGAEADIINRENGRIGFWTNNTERMRIDSSGRVMIGRTATGYSNTGALFTASGAQNIFVADGDFPLGLNRQTDDGVILDIRKDGTTVGSINSASGDLTIGTGDAGLRFYDAGPAIYPRDTSGNDEDGTVDLGLSSARFKNLYLSGGVYLGGTGSANHLDDYEEGTWTPQAFSNTTQITTSSANGFYTVVGNRVFINGAISRADSGSFTGNFYIKNLPFTPASNTSNWSMTGAMWFDKASATDVTAFSFLQNGVNQIYAKEVNTSNYVTADNLENSRPVYFSATYMKA